MAKSYFQVINDVIDKPMAVYLFYFLGLAGFATTAAFYWGLHNTMASLKEGKPGYNYFPDLTIAIFYIHIAVGGFVGFNALFYEKFIEKKVQVFVQAFCIIGPGSFNTLVVAGLLSMTAYYDTDAGIKSVFDHETNDLGMKPFQTNLAALICACLSNALMLAMMFLTFSSSQGTISAKVGLPMDSTESESGGSKKAKSSMYF